MMRFSGSLPSILLCHWEQRDIDTHYNQLIDFQYLQYQSNYTIGELEHGKYCESTPHPARLQQGQLTVRGSANLENTKNILHSWWASLPSIWLCQCWHRDMDMHHKQLIDFQYLQYKSNYLQYESRCIE